MKTSLRLLAVLTALLLLLTGCSRIPFPGAREPESTPDTGETIPADAPVWSYLGGRMENFAACYPDLTITALEYTRDGTEKETYVTADPELIDAVFQALNDISVVKETTDYDSYGGESFIFVTADNERFAVRFNQRNLDPGATYLIEHDAPLWKLSDQIRAAAEQAAAPTESPASLLPSPDPAPTPPPVESTQTGESERVTSDALDFSVAYDTSLRPEVTDEGSLRLYASDRDDMSYVEIRRVDNGPTAQEYLEDLLAAILAEQDEITMRSEAAEPVDIVGLDLYGIWANYVQEGEYVSMAAYAENIRGGILVYVGYFLEDTAESVLNGLETALLTAEYGMTNSMRVPEEQTPADDGGKEDAVPADSTALNSAPVESGGEGRWLWTASYYEDQIEYQIGALVLAIPPEWAGKYTIEYDGDYMSFCHTASYDRWMAEAGFTAGRLFTLCYTEDYDSIQYIPSYFYLGSDGQGGHYVLILPTDVQSYYEDEAIAADYAEMYDEIDFVENWSYILPDQ